MQSLGFTVLRRGRFGITARGPAELVADALGTALQVMAQPSARRPRSLASTSISDVGIAPQPFNLYLAPPRSLNLRSRISENIDHFVFTPPPIYFGTPTALPPKVGWRPINDASIRKLLRVPANGLTGKGVKVGIIDTGFYPHPYYAAHNIQRIPVVTSTNPAQDEEGHGTAILYNLVATSPQADIYAYAQSTPPQDSIEEAFDQGVQVLTCSWGYDNEMSFPILEATIRDGVQKGCIVLFAAGNGHHAWPGSMPDVLSIGGVYADPASYALQASNYVCGLCGQIPSGIYILMPTAPGCNMDQNLAGSPFDDFDETTAADGWCGASGTSSATPQIAGVVALLVEAAQKKGKSLSPDAVRQVLETSAQAVTTGRNAFGFPASADVPNTATGFGLVDVDAALKLLRKKGLA
jgi:subtilisin family serine protease